jgi:hypothetical protein
MRKLQATKRQGLSDKDKRKHHYTHENDRGISYEMARKIFEEKIQASKKHMLKFLESLSMASPNMRQMN